MFAAHNHEASLGDVMNSTIAKFYDDIDNCITVSEVVPGKYTYSDAPSYQSAGEIREKGRTRVDIHCQNYYIILMENSYIMLKQRIRIKIPKYETTHYVKKYYVGYLPSIAAIQQYRMFSETEPAFHQNDLANFEWLMLYNSYSDEAKENNEHFATLKKIREENPNVPGSYIDISGLTTDSNYEVDVYLDDLKIPLKHFTLFSNFKYYPSWMGKVIIDIVPSYSNIVIAPVVPEATFTMFPDLQTKIDAYNSGTTPPIFDLGWYQLNMPMKNRFKIAETYTVSGSTVTKTIAATIVDGVQT